MALSGHADHADECPLLEVKWTSRFAGVLPGFDPKRTWRVRCKILGRWAFAVRTILRPFLTWIKAHLALV